MLLVMLLRGERTKSNLARAKVVVFYSIVLGSGVLVVSVQSFLSCTTNTEGLISVDGYR